jgi:hypothetical protein
VVVWRCVGESVAAKIAGCVSSTENSVVVICAVASGENFGMKCSVSTQFYQYFNAAWLPSTGVSDMRGIKRYSASVNIVRILE